MACPSETLWYLIELAEFNSELISTPDVQNAPSATTEHYLQPHVTYRTAVSGSVADSSDNDPPEVAQKFLVCAVVYHPSFLGGYQLPSRTLDEDLGVLSRSCAVETSGRLSRLAFPRCGARRRQTSLSLHRRGARTWGPGGRWLAVQHLLRARRHVSGSASCG